MLLCHDIGDGMATSPFCLKGMGMDTSFLFPKGPLLPSLSEGDGIGHLSLLSEVEWMASSQF